MLIIYTIIYTLSMVLYYFRYNIIASGLMIALAIFLYVIDFRKEKRLITIKGLFALGFIGGFGVSLLKLSALSMEYSIKTFLVIYVSYFSMYLGSYFSKDKKLSLSNYKGMYDSKEMPYSQKEKILICFFIITFLAFVIEVIKLKFIPLMTIATPHAYSTFHVYMLHYITSLYVFIPSVAICNYHHEKSKRSRVAVLLSYMYVVLLSALMLSRGQLIMSIVLSVFVILILNGKDIFEIFNSRRNRLAVIIVVVILSILYVFITVHRAHDVAYLKGIFEMKDSNMPIYIAQPYMYVAHNYENLNYMINNLKHHTFGRMTLVPLFTLTFMKKLFPFAIGAPNLVIKEELSTKTLIYDSYYDFGIVGVMIFCFIIGYIGSILENYVYMIEDNKGSIKGSYFAVLFSLLCYYMLFSFMQSYFSLTDTWFNIIVLLIVCFIEISVSVVKKRNK